MPITFAELLQLAPTVAEPMLGRLRTAGLAMLGTVRADGSPRVSPIEVITEGDRRLYVGMMPGSRKAIDVERDPRVCLVTALAGREDEGGEGKVFGVARRVAPQSDADAVLAAHAVANGFEPEAVQGSPLFEIVVTAAAWQYVEDDTFITRSWRQGGVVRERHRVGATGDSVEVAPTGADGGVAAP